MAGLLDFANTDEGMQGLGLLAAAAPQMAPMNFAGRLAQAAQGYQGMKGEAMKRLDLEQQFKIKNIALQQQQQEWAMQMPLLKLMSDRMSGNAAPSAPQDQGAPMGQSGGMPSSQAMPAMSGSPQGQMPQQMGGQSSPPQGGSMFPGVPDSIALPVAAFGGMKAVIPLMTKYNEPTDLVKLMNTAGIDPASAIGRQILQQSIAKQNYMAPTRLGEGAYADPVNGVVGLPSAAQPGFINVKNPDGSWGTKQIGGGLDSVAESGIAKARGPATMAPEKVFNKATNQYEYQTKATIADAANGGITTGPVTHGNIKKFADINSINMAPPTIQDLNEINAALQSKTPRNAMQTQMLTQERDWIASALNAPQQAAAPQAGGAYAAEPSLGTTSNADAAQKATAQTMLDSYKGLQDANRTAPALLDAIAEMKSLAANKTPFVQSGLLGKVTNYVSTDAAKYEKLRANVIAQLAANSGTNGSDKGRDLTGEMVPEYNKPTDAQQFGLDTLDRQIRTQVLKNQAMTPTFKNGDAKAYTELESKFDQAIAPSLLPKLLPILSMPANASRGMLLKNLQNDPAMKKALTFATENGLLK